MSSSVYLIVLCALANIVYTLNLPGPLVYVVTPKSDTARSSAPFYYHNWMRRMDSPQPTSSTTTTTTTPSPDLIFAEFESDNGDNMRKSLRKLLEKERISAKTSTTTMKPILVAEESNEQISESKPSEKETSSDMEDYFAQYNKLYNAAPVYEPPSTSSTAAPTTTTTTTTEHTMDVANIWHIIDNEKQNSWKEVPLESEPHDTLNTPDAAHDTDSHHVNEKMPLNGITSGNGAENESRAIRTEPNFRFPYVDLKTFQMKNQKKSESKGSNMFMNLDNFQDIKSPVRGEAQDYMKPVVSPQQIDRYNPAQPYLPSEYGAKAKPAAIPAPQPSPTKSVASLVPPPPPAAPPKGNDAFPVATNYEPFPPYQSPAADSPAPVSPPATRYQPPLMDYDSDSPPSASADSGPPMDLGYRYKPPAPAPKPNVFVPTAASPDTLDKPFSGYSYKPPVEYSPPASDMGYTYNKPPMPDMSPPQPESPPPMAEKPKFPGYHYNKPSPPQYGHGPSYGPSFHHDQPDYPELIYDKPPNGMADMGGMMGGDTKAPDMDMGMKPPPPPADTSDGFPQDFPSDFKYHHDFEPDHDFHYHHHHPTTTTTTTTTETPRVNRYSYYYLGKKLYYLPLYFSVYFIVYVGALIIKAVLRHKIVYPNSWRPNDTTASFFAKRSVDSWDLSNERLHEVTGVVTKALATAAEKYMKKDKDA